MTSVYSLCDSCDNTCKAAEIGQYSQTQTRTSVPLLKTTHTTQFVMCSYEFIKTHFQGKVY